ncbi:MAG: isoprenylcysteine carboxylmethyltransferase family protein [Anaerolineae bacterium]|nr:isoprenylcysteine carboxylmethyltransferase family protein [Anaerolineae bacterium]
MNMRGRGAEWVAVQIGLMVTIWLISPDIAGLPAWPEPLRTISLIAGLLIGFFGVGLIMVGALNLGTNLSVFPRPVDDGALVQTGLYGIVRHPIYSGVILSALGWSLFRASIPALILTVVLVVFFDQKARREERWLEQKYPDYGSYRQRVRKLIPWVY